MAKKIDNRVGGMDWAKHARENIPLITSDTDNELCFAKDIAFARKYGVSRHTIYKIREDFGIPPRSDRILKQLTKMDLKKYTIRELSSKLGLKYQNLYKIIKDNKLETKIDSNV